MLFRMPNSTGKSTKTKRSYVWKHFDVEKIDKDGKKIPCLICKSPVSFDGSSTTPLIYHLMRFHKIKDDSNARESKNESLNENNQGIIQKKLSFYYFE